MYELLVFKVIYILLLVKKIIRKLVGRWCCDNLVKLNVVLEICNIVVFELFWSFEYVLVVLSIEIIRYDFDLNIKLDLGIGVGKVLDF